MASSLPLPGVNGPWKSTDHYESGGGIDAMDSYIYPFAASLAGDSTGELREQSWPRCSFRDGILRAVLDIESGKMDELLCMPQPEDLLLDDCLEPMMNLALHPSVDQDAPAGSRPASSATGPDSPRTPAPPLLRLAPAPTFHTYSHGSAQGATSGAAAAAATASAFCKQTRNPSWNATYFNHCSSPRTPHQLDMGFFNSVDDNDMLPLPTHNPNFPSAYFTGAYSEPEALTSQLPGRSNSITSAARASNMFPDPCGPDGYLSHLLSDVVCCPDPAGPPASLPRYPQHHLSTLASHRSLAEPQPRLTADRQWAAAAAQEQQRIPRSTSDRRVPFDVAAPLEHQLASRLGTRTSMDAPFNLNRFTCGQSDPGRQLPWTGPMSPSFAQQQHQESGACTCMEFTDLLWANEILDNHQAAASDPQLGVAVPLVPADEPHCAMLQPCRGGGRENPSSPAAYRAAPSKTQRNKISKHVLRRLFQYPIDDARRMMQVSKNAFKKTLLDCGFTGGWPQRQLVGLQRLMDSTIGDSSLAAEARKARLGRIQLNICAILDGTTSAIDDDLQKASHVYHNRWHHRRAQHPARDRRVPTSSCSSELEAAPCHDPLL